jgi:hypothetical protein
MIEVWNYNILSGDDLIGVLKVPFIDICEDENPTPRWGHLYGPPMCAKDEPPVNYATKMQIYGEELGSHYRGRLLYKVVGKKYVHSRNGYPMPYAERTTSNSNFPSSRPQWFH